MLRMPLNAASTATLIGIDPGSRKLGFCVITFDVITLEIVSVDAFTIVGEKLMNGNSFMGFIHGERFARIEALGERLQTLFQRYSPLHVASESPFFNPTRPNAFEPLVELIMTIRRALFNYDPWIPLYRIDPPTVKLGVGAVKAAKGENTKNPVRDAILAMRDKLNYIGKTALEKLDDNAIDSIAVGLTYLQILRGKICHKPRR